MPPTPARAPTSSGITGPPGVGKSTLVSRLIAAYRQRERTRRRDRDRSVLAAHAAARCSAIAPAFEIDPEDQGVFVRSMASRGRLGGLSALTPAAMVLMRAVYDQVIVETVGVGQSETDVAAVATRVVFCVQPGSGDSLQYIKAGIAEIPDVAVVTKADLGAHRPHAREDDLARRLPQQPTRPRAGRVPVLLISAQDGQGIAELIQAAGRPRCASSRSERTARGPAPGAGRGAGSTIAVREEFGRAGPGTGRGLARTRSTTPPGVAVRAHARAAPPAAAEPTPQPPADAAVAQELAQAGADRQDLGLAGQQRRPVGLGLRHLLEPQQRQALAVDARAHLARLALAQADDRCRAAAARR